MKPVLGIDFGTTNSVVSIFLSGEPVVIPSKRGNRLIPSAVSILEGGEVLVGEEAWANRFINPDRTILSIKRKMGTPFTVTVDGKTYNPVDIASYIFSYIKESAQEFMEDEVKDSVITVPANFDDLQRTMVKEAAERAGISVLRIINEPTAACIAHGIKGDSGRILVVDIGGGTYDVSLLEIEDGVFQVVSTDGDNVGGDDFDQALANYIIERFRKREGIDLREDTYALNKILQEAERVKMELSRLPWATFSIPFVTADARGPRHIEERITRKLFKEISRELLARIEGPVRSVLSEARVEPEKVDKVILVGGMGKSPLIREKLKEITGKPPVKGVDPQECVSKGASIFARELVGDGDGIVLVDVTPFSLGIEVEGGYFVPIISKNTPLPAMNKRIFTTVRDNQERVEIHILQGESRHAHRNTSLGRVFLEGIRPAKKGEPRIEVTFEIDVNGIVSVKAKDRDTRKEQRVRIERPWNG